jgi:hypothetical protein
MIMNGKRKFLMAVGCGVASFVLAWKGVVSGSEWVAVTSLVLGIHGAANVIDKKLGGAG